MTSHPIGHREALRTALWTAAVRARETARSDALLKDPLAAALAAPLGALDTVVGIDNLYPVIRTWQVDALVHRWCANGGRQVVHLGSGVDTRGWRLTQSSCTFFDLDRDLVLRYRDAITQRHGHPRPPSVVPVAVDLTDDWTDALTNAGLSVDIPTLWVAEGLLYYLDPITVRDLCSRALSLSCAGSRLYADVLIKAHAPEPARGAAAPYVGLAAIEDLRSAGWREVRATVFGHFEVDPPRPLPLDSLASRARLLSASSA